MSLSTTATTLTMSKLPGNTQKLSWLTMPPCRWADPALSIGQRCESLDPLRRYKYWAILDKSPAHAVWKAISKPIHILIQDQYEHLETNGCDIMIDMFMIGKKRTNASPTILFRCEKKSSREKAVELVSRKAILVEYPGVRLAQCSKFPKLLALGDEEDWSDYKSLSDDEESLDDEEPPDGEGLNTLAEGVYLDGPMTTYGLPVIIIGAENTPPRKATIGGFVHIDGTNYGLTTAHAFLPIENLQSQEQNCEFAFYGSDDSGSSDEDSDLPEMTSRGSISSSSSLRECTISPDGRNSSSSRVIQSSSMTPNNRDAVSPGLERLVNTDLLSGLSPARVGSLHTLSVSNGCDWALVKFAEEVWELLAQEVQLIRSPHVSVLDTKKVIKTQPENAGVLVHTRSGPIPGKLSAMSSFLVNGTYSQELWTVTLDKGCFSDGDCGSWVVGTENGDLYGHIVSGYPASGTAYLIPACHIIEDIEWRLDETVILPAQLSQRIEGPQMMTTENKKRVQVGHQQQQHRLPPVNPADQNPPCNTLYVGNLHTDVSEIELKSLFSQQPGYKRLCFRTKQNGPMCFVEFEDVSFATKALQNLYGHPLQNSVGGNIRLSFSKNPLGVRQSPNTSLSRVQNAPYEVDEASLGGLMDDVRTDRVLSGTWTVGGKEETPISYEADPGQGSSLAFSASADPYEDWTKLSDLAERRRLQNRIAQRNYRRRLRGRLEALERRQPPAPSQSPNFEIETLIPEYPQGPYYKLGDTNIEAYRDDEVEDRTHQEEATRPHYIPLAPDNLFQSRGFRTESDYNKFTAAIASRSGIDNNEGNVNVLTFFSSPPSNFMPASSSSTSAPVPPLAPTEVFRSL